MNTRLSLLAAIIFVPVGLASAGPLTEAHVTKIVNEVKLVDPGTGDRDAKLNDLVRDEIALTTGIKSRSELLFQDNTLTRLGPESYFSFKTGTRDMTLQKGTLLLQVPKGLGGAKIHTASVTAAITGTTIMMEYVPNKDIKVLVLEGTLRLSMNGRFGDSLLLTPGKMVIMSPTAKRIPDPVTVDLKKVVQTSKLVNMPGKPGKLASADTASLPSMSLIEKEINQQQAGKDTHRVADTNLVILGKGTNVVIGSDQLIADLTARTNVLKTDLAEIPPPPVPVTTPAPTPIAAPTPNSNPPPSGTPPPPPPVGYTIDNTTVITTPTSGPPTIVTQGVTTNGVVYKDLVTNGSPAGFLFGSASAFDDQLNFDNDFLQNLGTTAVFTFDSLQLSGGITFTAAGGPHSVALVGDNGITNTAGTVTLGGIQNILFATKSGSIVLDSGLTFNSSVDGSKPNLVEFYARSGDLNIGSTFNTANSTLEFVAENNAIFTGGTISAKNLEVTGLQTVQFDANANASSLFQLNGGDVEMGGTVNGKNGFFYGSSATINGTFNGEDFTANVTGDFTLNGSVSLVGNRQFQATAGGTATINGSILGNVTINAHDMAFGTDFTIGPSFKGELTATGGDIDATGHTLSGFDQILLNGGGNLTVGTLTANTLSVGGTLAGGSITANTITANALRADSVTANNTLTITSASLAPYSTGTISINTPSLTLTAGANLNGANGTPLLGPTNAFNLAITTGSYTLGTNISLNGGDGDPSVGDAGGNGGQLDFTTNGSLAINSPISATTGLNSTSGMTGGSGGTVNLTANNTITLNSKIEVSSNDGGRRKSARGGHININSTATGGTAISVSSSAQLLALLNAAAPGPGGSIKFTSAGGAINMSGTAQADRGTIEITNNGATGGQINLTNATLMADTIKVGALAPNGTLNIGGGTISADSLIKLYAGGSSGTVDFVDNVTLSGTSAKIIAANTVIINNGKIVTILGPSAANVFTNFPHYTGFGGDATTTGTFAGKGAVTHALSGAPGY
jgi:hypothetical protein